MQYSKSGNRDIINQHEIKQQLIGTTVKGNINIQNHTPDRLLPGTPKIPDYYLPSEIYQATRYFVPVKWQNKPPSDEQDLADAFLHNTANPLIPHLMNRVFTNNPARQTDHKFFLVLADSGMGKTTLLINLFGQWQAKKRHKEMRLYPIASAKTWQEIHQLKQLGKAPETILLLDAFDEDQAAVKDYKKRLQEIIELTQGFHKIVITSRTQFFPTKKDVLTETNVLTNKGYCKIRHMYVAPFDNQSIDKYLKKKFGSNLKFWNTKQKKRAKQIVSKAPRLMVRPMLLAYIDDLLGSEQIYSYSHEIYKEMVNKWIAREGAKVKQKKRRSFVENLQKFSVEVATHLYDYPTEGRYIIHYNELQAFATRYAIDLSRMEMQSKSLLNRNSEGYYKFSHKSVLEYFLLLKYMQDIRFAQRFDFGKMSQTKAFYEEIFETAYDKIIAQKATIAQAKDKFIFESFRAKAACLSQTRLNGIDLSGTYLREANLEKASLKETDLRWANLVQADLRWADLSKANLRNANLRRAYLIGANLEKTSLEGTFLWGANLSQTTLTQTQYNYAKAQKAVLRGVTVL